MVVIKSQTTGISLVSIIMMFLLSYHDALPANITADKVLSYYSVEYHEARDKFLKAAKDNGGRIYNYQNQVADPNDESLFLDVASFGSADAQTILVLGSGTHGVEGFAGSAIQTGLLSQGIVQTLPSNVELVMIHAINPFGFANLRRANEDNIDLNRNFLDHSKAHPPNEGYRQLADSIAPQSLSFLNDVKSLSRILWFLLRHGTSELRQAISIGQYTHAKGLFYGGSTASWSNKTIRMIALRFLSRAKHVVIIDFHTGLGDYGTAEVIMNVSEDSVAYQRAKKWWGDIVKSTVDGKAVSAHLHGTLKLAFPEMLPDSEVTAVSLEFGTLSSKDVLWALRSENWLHHQSSEHPDSKRIKNNLLRAFYPDDKEWKFTVWQKGKNAVEEVLSQLQPHFHINR